MMRKIIPLNREWFFKTYDEKDIQITQSTRDMTSIELPHNTVDIPYHYFDESITWGRFSYIRFLEFDESYLKKIVRLRFEGVAHRAEIYINGAHVMTHKGGYTPFEVDLTKKITIGKTMSLLVLVDTSEDPSIPPFGGVVDYLGYGGIYREVNLIVTDEAYIVDAYVEQKKVTDLILHVTSSVGEGELTVHLKQEDEIIWTEILNLNQPQIDYPFSVPDAILWDLDHPFLYQFVLEYKHKRSRDTYSFSFGIREAKFEKDGFYLNGKKVFLQGLDHHQSYPYVGYAMPKSAQEEDADILKYQLGCNIVRTSHYPVSSHFLKRCDEIGLLVFEEIPGWQHIGDESWKEQSLHDVKAMIERDRNHPSIIMWGVRINESADDHDFYQKANTLARSLDPTRPTGGVRNFAKSEFLEDVYTYNDFSHTGNNAGVEDKKKIIGDVPYLVTEYNGHMFPTKRFDDEKKRISHLLRHLNVMNDAKDPKKKIAGAIGWVFADYNTHKEFGSGDKICYHGVLDMFRIPKVASYAYQSQVEDGVFMEVTSSMNLGDHPAGNLGDIYILTNLDYVKLYKNDVFIKTFYPNQTRYPHLNHPPVVIDDYIGETLKNQEKMTEKDAEITKSVLKAAAIYGNHLPLKFKLKMLYILKKYKRSYDDAVRLFYTYMTGWGSKETVYRFEGYKNDTLMKVITKESLKTCDLVLEHNDKDLSVSDTYDVKRYVIKKVDQHQELLSYAFDPVTITTEGVIELIGPNQRSLLGGAIGFYIKANKAGRGWIKIESGPYVILEEVNVL